MATADQVSPTRSHFPTQDKPSLAVPFRRFAAVFISRCVGVARGAANPNPNPRLAAEPPDARLIHALQGSGAETAFALLRVALNPKCVCAGFKE